MNRKTVEEAVTRFNDALEGLQSAVEHRKINEDQLGQLEGDLHLMALDRAQLARNLDETLAKNKKEQVLRETLSARLDQTILEIDALIIEAEAA
jgi:hypothetical protein